MVARKYTHKEAVARAASYYRANPHRFVKEFLHIDLRWFQKIIIYAMNEYPAFCMIASRGLGKSFLIAIYCCVRCVLYPGTKICIASGTRGQAKKLVISCEPYYSGVCRISGANGIS